MADPIDPRVRKQRKATRSSTGTSVAAPQHPDRRSATIVQQENPMDLWLRDELRRLYAHVLDDPLPPALVELLWAYETCENFNSRNKATGRKH